MSLLLSSPADWSKQLFDLAQMRTVRYPLKEGNIEDATAGAVSAAIKGLTPGTTYHFRVGATNAAGTSYGQDVTFANNIACIAVAAPKEIGSQSTAPRITSSAVFGVRCRHFRNTHAMPLSNEVCTARSNA